MAPSPLPKASAHDGGVHRLWLLALGMQRLRSRRSGISSARSGRRCRMPRSPSAMGSDSSSEVASRFRVLRARKVSCHWRPWLRRPADDGARVGISPVLGSMARAEVEDSAAPPKSRTVGDDGAGLDLRPPRAGGGWDGDDEEAARLGLRRLVIGPGETPELLTRKAANMAMVLAQSRPLPPPSAMIPSARCSVNAAAPACSTKIAPLGFCPAPRRRTVVVAVRDAGGIPGRRLRGRRGGKPAISCNRRPAKTEGAGRQRPAPPRCANSRSGSPPETASRRAGIGAVSSNQSSPSPRAREIWRRTDEAGQTAGLFNRTINLAQR